MALGREMMVTMMVIGLEMIVMMMAMGKEEVANPGSELLSQQS